MKSKMTAGNFLQDLRKNVYCRLQASPIHGVGVFAIKDIPRGIDPMPENRAFKFNEVKRDYLMADKSIPEAVKNLVIDMCPEEDGIFYVPNCSLNEIGIGFYLNHSKTPNMLEKDGGEYFVTARDIKAGEELFVDYGTYSEENL